MKGYAGVEKCVIKSSIRLQCKRDVKDTSGWTWKHQLTDVIKARGVGDVSYRESLADERPYAVHLEDSRCKALNPLRLNGCQIRIT